MNWKRGGSVSSKLRRKHRFSIITPSMVLLPKLKQRFVSCWCFTLSRSSLGWRYFFLIDLLAQEITSTGVRTHHHHSFLQICVFFPERLGLATSMNSQGHQRQQFRFNSTDKFESTIVEQGGLDVHNHVSGSPWCIGLILVCASDLPNKPNV